MRTMRVRKRSGEYRVVVVPDKETKRKLRHLNASLTAKARNICDYSVHGCMPARSAVTNALAHVGHRVTVSFDLSSFFDSVTREKLGNKIDAETLSHILVDPGDGIERACQGLPTSPAAANIAASPMDAAIQKWLQKHVPGAVYTRYVDDIAISFGDESHISEVLRSIPAIVSRCGFRINPRKTTVQHAIAGKRIITGVAVGHDSVSPTRATKRKLRAALHHAARGESEYAARARGLMEWASVKCPAENRAQDWRADLNELQSFWGLRGARYTPNPMFPEVSEGALIITRDPAYVLGMSSYTTGWSTCMSQPHGRYCKGAAAFTRLLGAGIAALLSDRSLSFGGVERRVMRARCLVFRLRTGIMVYDRIYGDWTSSQELGEALRARGILPVSEARAMHPEGGVRVEGNIPISMRMPYLDTLTAKRATTSTGKKVRVLTI